MDPFTEINLFLRVVELGSIRAVAREQGLEPSSVSRRIASLESRLRSTLIDRTATRSRATERGMVYYERMRELLPQIEAVEGEVAGDSATPKGLLKVSASIDFGQLHVTRWLLDFRRLYPEVEIELVLASQFVDISTEGIDVAVRVGALKDSALKARKLADVPRVLAASPGYLAKWGVPETPDDLSEHQFVFFDGTNRHERLKLVGPDNRHYAIRRRGAVTINAVASAVEAVKADCGIHIGPRWAFQAALERGEVVEVLPGYTQPAMPMHIIWRSGVLMPARVRAFVDFAVEAVKDVDGLRH
ncbi:MAG: LysR family transcriptional regulator [Pseudomonadota bacterium]